MRIVWLAVKIIVGLVLLLVLIVAGMALSLRATPPATVFDLRSVATEAADPRPVLVFGASGGTGYQVAKLLRERGQPVTAAVRATTDRSPLEELGVDFVVADAFDLEAVQAATGSANFQAVITTVGCLRCKPPPDFIGNRNIIDAARANGVERFILISTVGAGDSYDAANLLSRIVLRPVLPLKTQAEDHLRASGLAYTIIRPGGLRPESREATGLGYLTEDNGALGFIHRADLARLIVAALDDDRTVGMTFTAADPGIDTPWQ